MATKPIVLLVDDDILNRRIGEGILKDRYEVHTASSGTEALEYLKNAKVLPTLMLLDLHMPVLSGFDVMRKMKEDIRYEKLPVIILTADDDKSCEVEGFKLGVMDFITKPMVGDVLRERINRVVELDKRQKDLSIDRLTGLNMRNVGESEIEKAIKREPGFLAFMDVDNLKKINDTIGHDAGDRVLKLVGDVLREYTIDMLTCRMGGDEFLLYFYHITQEELIATIEKIIRAFTQRKDRDSGIRAASVSIGIVQTDVGDSYKEAYQKADKALYHVKQDGKDGYFIYRESNDEISSQEKGNLDRLKSALRKTGSYHGAMNVEFREFAKLYEYFSNLKTRYQHRFYLMMITADSSEISDSHEAMMDCLEESIRQMIRSVDVCTRYSVSQFLLILMNPGDDDSIEQIGERIRENFGKMWSGEEISLSTFYTEME